MRALALFLFLIACPTAFAQKLLREPLTAIPADSVGLWDMGTTNWRMMAKQFNKQVVAQPFAVERKAVKRLQKAKWQKNVSWSGGHSPLFNAEEGYQATQTMNNAVQLFLLTGESQSIDLVERALFNALPYALHRPDVSAFDKGITAQALYNGIGAIYATTQRNVYTNFYLNSFVRLRLDTLRLTLDQITGMPYLPNSKFRIGGLPKGLHKFTLRLRLPSWAKAEETTLYVNGHDEDLRLEKGYIVIDRSWRNGDEAYLQFSLKPQMIQDAEGQRAFTFGPLLLVPRPTEQRPTTPFPKAEDLELIEDEASSISFKAGDWEFVPLQDMHEKVAL